MEDQNVLSKIQGCLLGVAIGDAMGMPVETMSAEAILDATSGKGISGFVKPMSGRKWVAELKAGDTTDDWQLTRAVARSLCRTRGRFDMADCAAEHVRELDKSVFGWGKTTEQAIAAIKCGERKVGKDWLTEAAPGKGCGNGIIMKVAPLALSHYLTGYSWEDAWFDTRLLGLITHPDLRASIAAYAVSLYIQLAMIGRGVTSSEKGLSYLPDVISIVKKIESQENIDTDLVSDRLEMIPANLGSAQELRTAVGCGFHSLDTAAFTIGTFVRHPTDFRAAILEAVNAGGDADSNASIVGALVGANLGLIGIPEDWQSFREDFTQPLVIGAYLYNRVSIFH